MVKKETKKKIHHAVHHSETHHEPTVIREQAPQDLGISKVMLENFVSLQKVMTNLSLKLDGLTTQISKLLEIFEISAKALAEKEFEVEGDNKEISDKLNNLLDQNKILARGLSLMHERIPREQPQMQQMQPSYQQTMQSSPYMREMQPQNQPQASFQNQRPIKPLSQEISDSQPNFQKQRFESPVE
jgi:hypothetical protein